ncbi:MAG TPA: hypothetical protein VLG74_06515 [Blastocatellia bacterium]|nr:hypothetical protein [Blastocatellia bacterium]
MRILMLSAVLFTLMGSGGVRAITSAFDISGTWIFSVDLESGDHGDPTFVFKQDKETLTGSYDGPLGQQKVTGTVKENKAVFGFEFTIEGVTNKATYTGTIESATRMTGTVEFSGGRRGKWTATRK